MNWSKLEDDIIRTYPSNKIAQVVLLDKGYARSLDAIKHRRKRLRLDSRFNCPEDLPKLVSDIQPNPVKSVSVSGDLNWLEKQLQEIGHKKREEAELAIYTPDEIHPKQSLLLILSDIHLGKKITSPSNGVIYNTSIACERIKSIPDKIAHLTPVDEIVVVLVGDLMDGEGIYPGQATKLDSNIPEQVIQATGCIWKLLTTLQTQTKQLRVVTTKGNHGKTGLSPEANFDTIIYKNLEYLAGSQFPVINTSEAYNTFQIHGQKFLIRHKAPVDASTPSNIKMFLGWKSIHNCDGVIYGHWHHWGVEEFNGLLLIRNGSLSGGDDYGESLGLYDPPTQLVISITPDKFPQFIYPITWSN